MTFDRERITTEGCSQCTGHWCSKCGCWIGKDGGELIYIDELEMIIVICDRCLELLKEHKHEKYTHININRIEPCRCS